MLDLIDRFTQLFVSNMPDFLTQYPFQPLLQFLIFRDLNVSFYYAVNITQCSHLYSPFPCMAIIKEKKQVYAVYKHRDVFYRNLH